MGWPSSVGGESRGEVVAAERTVSLLSSRPPPAGGREDRGRGGGNGPGAALYTRHGRGFWDWGS